MEDCTSNPPPPLVSVVMAVHSGVNTSFLREAVSSVLSQTHKNMEFLVVADGPLTSHQKTVLNNFLVSDERIRLFNLEHNQGPGFARNFAIKKTVGDFVAIMDSDDVSETSRLEEQISFLKINKDVDVLGTSYIEIDSYGRESGRKPALTGSSITEWMPIINPINNPTVMFRSSLRDSFRYDEQFRYGEDYRLWVDLLLQGVKIDNMDKPLLRFRIKSGHYTARRGLHRARTDFLNKVHALKLIPLWKRPIYFFLAPLTLLVRLLPSSVVMYLTQVSRE